MRREISGISPFSHLLDLLLWCGFIAAQELAIRSWITAFEYFFCFLVSVLCLLPFVGFPEPKCQYTKARFYGEIIISIGWGVTMAHYGYVFFATVLTFTGLVTAYRNYFSSKTGAKK